MRILPAMVAICGLMTVSIAYAQVDDEAAQALMKKSGCFKCHSVDKKKDGPAYRTVANKYKGKPEAEEKLFKHVTTNPKIKIDGNEEDHKALQTKSEPEIRNVVHWILSR